MGFGVAVMGFGVAVMGSGPNDGVRDPMMGSGLQLWGRAPHRPVAAVEALLGSDGALIGAAGLLQEAECGVGPHGVVPLVPYKTTSPSATPNAGVLTPNVSPKRPFRGLTVLEDPDEEGFVGLGVPPRRGDLELFHQWEPDVHLAVGREEGYGVGSL